MDDIPNAITMTTIDARQQAQIRSFVLGLIENNSKHLEDNESLVRSGLLDSIKLARLVIFLEGELGFHIDDEDLVNESFENINTIFSLIEKNKNS